MLHRYSVCVVVLCLFVCSWQLVVSGYYYIIGYPITSNGSAPRQKEQVAYRQAGQLAEMGDYFRHITHVYIMYLRYEDAIRTCDSMHRSKYCYHSCRSIVKQFNIPLSYQMYYNYWIYNYLCWSRLNMSCENYSLFILYKKIWKALSHYSHMGISNCDKLV